MNMNDLSVRTGDTELLDALEKAVKDGAAVIVQRSRGYFDPPTRIIGLARDYSLRKAIEDAFIQLPKAKKGRE